MVWRLEWETSTGEWYGDWNGRPVQVNGMGDWNGRLVVLNGMETAALFSIETMEAVCFMSILEPVKACCHGV